MSVSYSTPVRPESKSRNWRMSVPETNARPPAPRSTRTRRPSSASTSSQRSTRPSYIANVIALRACGRLNVRIAVDPRRSKSRSGSAITRRAAAGSGRRDAGPLARLVGGGLAVGTHAPERHLRLVDEEVGGLARGEARRGADDAVDVVGRAARAAHEMVVVVADARLVARGAPGGLDPAQEADAGHRVQAVVHRLGRDRAERLAHARGDRVGVGMARQLAHGAQDRDAGRGRPQPVIAELI